LLKTFENVASGDGENIWTGKREKEDRKLHGMEFCELLSLIYCDVFRVCNPLTVDTWV
jgi:hypothetical protein